MKRIRHRLMFIENPGQPEGGSGAPAPTDPPKADPPASEAPKEDELPEHWRTELTRARGEAASYRTQLRAAQTALEGAKTAEDFQTAVSEWTAKNETLERDLLRERAARKYGLPDELAGRVQGKDETEMEADAKALAALVKAPTPAPVRIPGGGLDPQEKGIDTLSPAELAGKFSSRLR